VSVERLAREWDMNAEADPFWSVLTHPGLQGNRWDVGEFFAIGEREAEWLLAHVERIRRGGLRRDRALDFGCGIGRVTGPLADRFRETIGLDVSSVMVRLARHHNAHRPACRFVVNRRPDLAAIPDASIDLLYSKLTPQHMEPQLALGYLPEFVRVLRPGGVAVFQVLHVVGERGGAQRLLPAAIRRRLRQRRRRTIRRERAARHAVARSMGIQIATWPLRREDVSSAVAECGGVLLDQRHEEIPSPGRMHGLYTVGPGTH
jgi:SAM-dependent methyltransferase